MALVLRSQKGSNLSSQEVDGNFLYLSSSLGTASPFVSSIGANSIVQANSCNIANSCNSFVAGGGNTAYGRNNSIYGGVGNLIAYEALPATASGGICFINGTGSFTSAGDFTAYYCAGATGNYLFYCSTTNSYSGYYGIPIANSTYSAPYTTLYLGAPYNTFSSCYVQSANFQRTSGFTTGSGYYGPAFTYNAILSGKFNAISGQYGGGNRTVCNSVILGGVYNYVACEDSAIVAGCCNVNVGYASFIGGGQSNYTCWSKTVVVGGAYNTSTGLRSVVVGGSYNSSTGCHTTVVGGCKNSASGYYTTVGGGCNNSVSGYYGSILGGNYNTVTGGSSFIGSGNNNLIEGSCSFIGSGNINRMNANAYHSAILTGYNNIISGSCSTISSGYQNTIVPGYSFIGTGILNSISDCGFIGGGNQNCITGGFGQSFIGYGFANLATNFNNFIGNGTANKAYGSVIVGGSYHCASGSAIVGGSYNYASSGSFIGAGFCNCASSSISVIAGGCKNFATGEYSGILGGAFNTASAAFAGAFGCNLKANVACTYFVNNFCACGTGSFTSNLITSGSLIVTGSLSMSLQTGTPVSTVAPAGYYKGNLNGALVYVPYYT